MAQLIAYVALRKDAGGTEFAYLPSTSIPLPAGWNYGKDRSGNFATQDVTAIAQGASLEETCRMMSSRSGITL